MNMIKNTSEYQLLPSERKAVEEAIEESEKDNIHKHNDVIAEAKQKYPNLVFVSERFSNE